MSKCSWFGHKEKLIHEEFEGVVRYRVFRCTRCSQIRVNGHIEDLSNNPAIRRKAAALLEPYTRTGG